MSIYAALADLLPADTPEIVLLKKDKKIKTRVEDEKTVITTCTMDCGGSCPLKVHLKGEVIQKITPCDDGKEPPLTACIRGRNYHCRVYAPDRLKYPLKRTGKRGEGRFKRISWEEAAATIVKEMKRIKKTYGTEAILECAGAGSVLVMLHSTTHGPFNNLLKRFGRQTVFGTGTSFEGAAWATRFTYGMTSGEDSSSFSDLINSKLIILWGFNPAEVRQGTGTMHWLNRAKAKGVKIICVDPCRTETVKALSAEWVPVRPSTDTAMLISMAYVMIEEDIYDTDFVDRYVFGFDRYKDYVLGGSDGIPKTPAWAENITGVPEDVIAGLAGTYASFKPAALIQGWAPGRTANGEQYHRAAIALQAMTGNIGVKGGSSSCCGMQFTGGSYKKSLFPLIQNHGLPEGSGWDPEGIEIKSGKWADAVIRGKSGGYPSDIKMLYITGQNILNQQANLNKSIEAFKKVDFIVCQDQFLTPTARYSDILLPANTCFERSDISIPWLRGNYAIFANKAIDSLWDSKSDLDIARMLADKLNITDFYAKPDDELLKAMFEKSFLTDIVSYEEFKKKGLLRLEEEPFIAFKEQIADPGINPFPTPSGKIELYSRGLDKIDFDVEKYSGVIPDYRNIPRVPTFIQCDELPGTPKARKYPLQLTTPHSLFRTHSQYDNIPRLRKLYRHEAWINTEDAAKRGIADGDRVRVFNDRGAILVYAKVTDRITKGVTRCYEGTWYDPVHSDTDAGKMIDRGGCVNVLIDDMLTSPGGASNCNTCLVEVEIYKGPGNKKKEAFE